MANEFKKPIAVQRIQGRVAACFSIVATFAKEAYAKTNEEKMGIQGQDRFHASTVGIIYKECFDYRPHSRFQESFSKRAWVRHENAHVLHKSSGTRIRR
jgi:hypothetical protein